jgi:hypothetical protein
VYLENLIIFKATIKVYKTDVVIVIPALRRLQHENCELKASIGYIVRLCFKKIKKDGWQND